MAIYHRCIDIENRKTAGSDNPLSLFVWLLMMIGTMVFPIDIWTKLFIITIEYVICKFFIRGTERDMRFWVGYQFSARTYSSCARDDYVPLEEFCKPVIRVVDKGEPISRDDLFE